MIAGRVSVLDQIRKIQNDVEGIRIPGVTQDQLLTEYALFRDAFARLYYAALAVPDEYFSRD